MKNRSFHEASEAGPVGRRRRLAAFLALLAATGAACGDLDETDSDPPSVNALASWDASHLVAVRTYHKDPVLLDLQSGRKTGTLVVGKYYQDIATLGNGEFTCLHNQSIDFFRADGTLDESRSIPGTVLTRMTISGDRSTLAYAAALDPTRDTINIVDLPSGQLRFTPDVSFNLASSLSVSRDGTMVAFVEGDVTVARVEVPGTVSTCVLEYDPGAFGGPLATTFSPSEDKLAVSKVEGGLNIFDLGHYPECRLLLNIPPPDDPSGGLPWSPFSHIEFSPDGSMLAVSVEKTESSLTMATGAIRLVAVDTGAVLKELSVYQWEKSRDPRAAGSPLISDLEWSATGDRLTVSMWDGPVQQWDVATGTLLWSARL